MTSGQWRVLVMLLALLFLEIIINPSVKQFIMTPGAGQVNTNISKSPLGSLGVPVPGLQGA